MTPPPHVPKIALVSSPPLRDLDADARLVQAVAEGHPGAHRALWVRFTPLVRRLVQRQLGPSGEGDVEDLVQDVFALVFRDLKNLREPRAVGSFVATVTVHALRRELRRRKFRRLIRLTSTGHAPDVESNDSDPVTRLALQRVYAALDRFKVVDRMVFVLRFVEGQDVQEVAAALEISPATVKRKSAHVVAKLAAQMRGDPFMADFLQVEERGREHG